MYWKLNCPVLEIHNGGGGDADTRIEVARIEADAKKHAEEVRNKATEAAAPLLKQLEELGRQVDDVSKKLAADN